MPKGLLYHYFPRKEALIDRALDAYLKYAQPHPGIVLMLLRPPGGARREATSLNDQFSAEAAFEPDAFFARLLPFCEPRLRSVSELALLSTSWQVPGLVEPSALSSAQPGSIRASTERASRRVAWCAHCQA
jgi:AcrR family transcriptional regulator